MNLLGKILVGVLFVMSIMFMSFAIVVYSTQHNWKNDYEKLAKDLKTVKDESDRLSREKTSLEQQRDELMASLQQQIDKLNGKNAELTKENAQLAEQMVSLRDGSDNAVKTLELTQQNMNNLSVELKKVREELATAQMERQKIFTDLVAANDRAQTLALELATLTSTNQKLAKDYANARQLLDKLNYTLDPTAYTNIPPRVLGTITETRPTGMVELSIGSDDGLLQGHRLHVYRETDGVASYLGVIEVVSTEPSKAVGKIIRNFETEQ